MNEQRPEFHPYHHPAAGWGAAKSVTGDYSTQSDQPLMKHVRIIVRHSDSPVASGAVG